MDNFFQAYLIFYGVWGYAEKGIVDNFVDNRSDDLPTCRYYLRGVFRGRFKLE